MHLKTTSILVLFCLAFLAFVPLSLLTPTASAATSCPSSDTLRMTMTPLPDSFSDLTGGGSADFQVMWMEKLTLYPISDLPNGGLNWAEAVADWASHNANYTQWTFNVRPGLKWSNGSPVTSSDIVNTYSPSYGLNPLYDVENLRAEVVNVHTLNSSAAVFVLNTTDPHFADEVSNLLGFSIEPQQDIAQGPAYNMFGPDVGDGPYINSLGYTSGSTSLVLTRNPYYTPTPTACAIDVNFVETSAYMTQFLVSGQSDLLNPIAPGSIAPLLNVPNVHIFEFAGAQEQALSYNPGLYPYNMTQFRQALAYGINDSAIVQYAEFGYGIPAYNSTGGVPFNVASYNPNQPSYSFNTQKALQLLHSIGFTTDSSGKLHYPNGTVFSTTLWTDTAKSEDSSGAPLVAKNLQDLGMQITVQTVSHSELRANFNGNGFGTYNDLVLYSSGGVHFFDPWLTGQQPCIVMGTPGCHTVTFSPPSAFADYNSNLTALNAASDVPTLIHYLKNIQGVSSVYLPMIPLTYPDVLTGYNTARFTNWPTPQQGLMNIPTRYNLTMFTGLELVGASSSTTTTTTSSNHVTTTSQSTSGGGASTTTTPTTIQSTTTTSTSQGIAYPGIGVLVLVALLLLASLAFFGMRGREKGTKQFRMP